MRARLVMFISLWYLAPTRGGHTQRSIVQNFMSESQTIIFSRFVDSARVSALLDVGAAAM